MFDWDYDRSQPLDSFTCILVIFVGGVAFSIAHAIVPIEDADIIKTTAEVRINRDIKSMRFLM